MSADPAGERDVTLRLLDELEADPSEIQQAAEALCEATTADLGVVERVILHPEWVTLVAFSSNGESPRETTIIDPTPAEARWFGERLIEWADKRDPQGAINVDRDWHFAGSFPSREKAGRFTFEYPGEKLQWAIYRDPHLPEGRVTLILRKRPEGRPPRGA